HTLIDGRATGEQRVRFCGSAVQGQRAEFWVERRSRSPHLVAPCAESRGKSAAVADQVITPRDIRAVDVREGVSGPVPGDDRVDDIYRAEVEGAAGYVRRVVGDG